jgi:hypothetical protein
MNYWGRSGVSPAANVIALPVPAIPAGGQVAQLGRAQYEWLFRERAAWRGRRAPKPEDMPDLPTLWDQQQVWIGSATREFGPPLRRWDETSAHAFLASTRSFYLHCRANFEDVNNLPVTADGLMGCDVSHWLVQGWAPQAAPPGQTLAGQGVLLLAAQRPGPAELRGDGRRLGPVSGQSIYRVRVPLAYQGSPPVQPSGEAP